MGAILVVPEPDASADSTTAMTLVRLDPDVHSAAKCLDGSTAGYYHRPGKPESAGGWVVYLEEGGWCFTLEECRGLQHGQQGSSVWWPDIRHDSGGLLSASGIDDPDMSTWHKVLVPSCDATSFASNRSSPVPIPPPSGQGKGGQIWLRGAEIIMAIVVDIQERYGFSGRVLFAGSGSGGLAVLLHLDAIATKIKNSCSAVVSDVVGLADSAFIPAMLAGKVTHAVALFKDAVELWHPKLPLNGCGSGMQGWNCLFAQQIVAQLRTPVFIVQSLHDCVHMRLSLSLHDRHEDLIGLWEDAVETALLSALSWKKHGFFINTCPARVQVLMDCGIAPERSKADTLQHQQHGGGTGSERDSAPVEKVAFGSLMMCNPCGGWRKHYVRVGCQLISVREAFGDWYFAGSSAEFAKVIDRTRGVVNPSCRYILDYSTHIHDWNASSEDKIHVRDVEDVFFAEDEL